MCRSIVISMKKSVILTMCGVVIVGGGIFWAVQNFADGYLTRQGEAAQCGNPGATHTVTIAQNQMHPSQTIGALCDTLTITNTDNTVRRIAFGRHNQHQPYDGITEKSLKKGESFTVRLNQTGTYTLHDHLNEKVTGGFTVTKQ